jgi:DNA-directed RNA polymerase sigma subunit (sigma70/sigma32)
MLPNYFHEIGKIPLLTAEEEAELSLRVQAGCEAARNRMIAANLRLVVRIAGEFGHLGLPMADLISEGNLGLVKAVERFRPFKGSKFSSYALVDSAGDPSCFGRPESCYPASAHWPRWNRPRAKPEDII